MCPSSRLTLCYIFLKTSQLSGELWWVIWGHCCRDHHSHTQPDTQTSSYKTSQRRNHYKPGIQQSFFDGKFDLNSFQLFLFWGRIQQFNGAEGEITQGSLWQNGATEEKISLQDFLCPPSENHRHETELSQEGNFSDSRRGPWSGVRSLKRPPLTGCTTCCSWLGKTCLKLSKSWRSIPGEYWSCNM